MFLGCFLSGAVYTSLSGNEDIRNIGYLNQPLLGTENLYSGFDWTVEESFKISYNSGLESVITLDTETSGYLEAVAYVQSKINEIYTGNEFTVSSSANKLLLSVTDNNFFDIITGSTSIGWAKNFYGYETVWSVDYHSGTAWGARIQKGVGFDRENTLTTVKYTTTYDSDHPIYSNCRSFSGAIGVAAAHDSTVGIFGLYKYSTNGGNTWSDDVQNTQRPLDWFNLGGLWRSSVTYDGLEEKYYCTFFRFNPTEVARSIEIDTNNSVYGGMLWKGEYYFVYKNPSNDMILAKLTSSPAITTVETLDIDEPASFSPYNQQYIRQGMHEFLLDADYFRVRKIGTTTWQNIPGSGESAVGIIWTYFEGNYIVKYVIFKDSIFRIFPNGGWGKVQEIDLDSARAGINNWFVDFTNSQLFMYNQTGLEVVTTNGEISNGYMKPWYYKFQSPQYTGWVSNQMIEVYDPVYPTTWIIRDVIDKKNVECINTSSIDMDRPINGYFSGLYTHDILNQICTGQLDFIHYYSGNTTGTIAPVRNYKDTLFSDVLKDMDGLEGRQSLIYNDYSLKFLSTPPSSNITLIASGDAVNIADITLTERKSSLAEVNVFGANGQRATVRNGLGNNTANFYRSHASGSELTTFANNIISQGDIKILNIKSFGSGYFQYGESFNVHHEGEGITGTTWYLYEVLSYSPELNMLDGNYYNLVYQQFTSPLDKSAEKAIEALEPRIQYNEERVKENSSDLAVGAANHVFKNAIFEGANEVGKHFFTSAGVINVDGTDNNYWYKLDLATNLPDGKKLYVDAFEITINDADANDLVDEAFVYGDSTAINSQTPITLNTARTVIYTFREVDCSIYRAVKVRINTSTTTAEDLDVGTIRVRYYYA